MGEQLGTRKTFILDTSVLLYDRCSIHSFPGNDVVIPLSVLDELDRFKGKPGILGEAARYVNRYLDNLRKKGNLHDGIEIEEDQTIRVEINHGRVCPVGLDASVTDNLMIGLAQEISKTSENPVILVTKDINFRVKCDALGINSKDYYKDQIVSSESNIYPGFAEIEVDDPEIIEDFYNNNYVEKDRLSFSLCPNQYVALKYESQSLLGVVRGGRIVPLSCNLHSTINVSPKNKEQKFALDLLTRDDIPLVTLTGLAGSGKTFLTLMAGLSGIASKKYERIIITRSMQTVGKDIGFLPGSVKEKMEPWIGPIADNFRYAFKDLTYFQTMQDKGVVELCPLSFIRGRTFSNTFIIVDEAQNTTIHELKTVITRVGEGSKIVILGDIEQIDTPYIDSLSNGLTIVVEKFKTETLSGHMTLNKGERSSLATVASRIL